MSYTQEEVLRILFEVGDMEGRFANECENCDKTFIVEFEYRPYNKTYKK